MQLQDMGVKPFAILFAIIATGPIVAGVAIAVLTLGVIGFSMLNRSAVIQNAELTVRSTF